MNSSGSVLSGPDLFIQESMQCSHDLLPAGKVANLPQLRQQTQALVPQEL